MNCSGDDPAFFFWCLIVRYRSRTSRLRGRNEIAGSSGRLIHQVTCGLGLVLDIHSAKPRRDLPHQVEREFSSCETNRGLQFREARDRLNFYQRNGHAVTFEKLPPASVQDVGVLSRNFFERKFGMTGI